ncbi:hypothetical protein [Rhodococcus sp. USK13]|nr:hypothetical protein [Rhodococcus sp. USK13]
MPLIAMSYVALIAVTVVFVAFLAIALRKPATPTSAPRAPHHH